jgi:hypothetical protein
MRRQYQKPTRVPFSPLKRASIGAVFVVRPLFDAKLKIRPMHAWTREKL